MGGCVDFRLCCLGSTSEARAVGGYESLLGIGSRGELSPHLWRERGELVAAQPRLPAPKPRAQPAPS